MIEHLASMWQELLVVFGISMVPVLELRGAIPIAIAYDIPWQIAYLLCVVGNMFPVPFIIAYMKPLFGFIRRSKLFVKLIDWLEARTMKKAETVLKYFHERDCHVMVATHDMQLAKKMSDKYACYHFNSQMKDNDISFDYMICDGYGGNTNAIDLLSCFGFPEEIVSGARACINSE